MYRSDFHVAAMDCPSEEQQIRGALSELSTVEGIEVDFGKRALSVWHTGDADPILHSLERLKLGTELLRSEEDQAPEAGKGSERDQSRVLRLLLAINGVMFVVELVAGWIGDSTGLLSDSLDMLADATVYGIALAAVGHSGAAQRRAAKLSGWLEMALACGVLIEVVRKFVMGSAPEGPMMMATAGVALVANLTCMLALSGHRSGGIHMRASWIFSTNDVIANLGVIAAGALVLWTSSPLPDLLIGTLIGLVVLRGALRILAMTRAES